jgi:hypothetical protein
MRPHAAGFESVQKIPREEAKSALGYLRAFLTHSPAQPTSPGRRGRTLPEGYAADASTKVTIFASNYNASKEVLEKFKHSSENKPKKRYSRNSLLPSEGRYWSPSLGLGFSSILVGADRCTRDYSKSDL